MKSKQKPAQPSPGYDREALVGEIHDLMTESSIASAMARRSQAQLKRIDRRQAAKEGRSSDSTQ